MKMPMMIGVILMVPLGFLIWTCQTLVQRENLHVLMNARMSNIVFLKTSIASKMMQLKL